LFVLDKARIQKRLPHLPIQSHDW